MTRRSHDHIFLECVHGSRARRRDNPDLAALVGFGLGIAVGVALATAALWPW